jgi:hypothetical protein
VVALKARRRAYVEEALASSPSIFMRFTCGWFRMRPYVHFIHVNMESTSVYDGPEYMQSMHCLCIIVSVSTHVHMDDFSSSIRDGYSTSRNVGRDHPFSLRVPYSGATAAAMEGCARTPVGTHPYLLVVGGDNAIAMPCLTRLGARRGRPTVAIRMIISYRESLVRRAFVNDLCALPAPKSPAWPVRCVSL